VLGEGAYGKVLLVTEKGTRAKYAMKVSKEGDHGLFLLKEGLMHGKMSEYPNFPTYHGLYSFVEGRVLLTEVCGPDLSKVLTDSGPMSDYDLFWVGQQMVQALKDLHSNEIVHNDVKPSNIFSHE
jgi:wee1-like protein kinase